MALEYPPGVPIATMVPGCAFAILKDGQPVPHSVRVVDLKASQFVCFNLDEKKEEVFSDPEMSVIPILVPPLPPNVIGVMLEAA